MDYRKELGQYKRVNVETAGKLDLVLMCYEKCIELLRQAKEFMEQKEYEKKARKAQKAFDIIHNLQSSLNFEKGGQIARNLDSLYSYMVRRILEGDVKKDTTAYQEAITILSELKEAWEGIASRPALKTDRAEQVLPEGRSLEVLAA